MSLEIETENCLIRKFSINDVNDLHEVLSNKEVMKYIEKPYSREKVYDFILQKGLTVVPLIYAIEYKENNKVIGYLIFHRYKNVNEYEIGWILNYDYWGLGLASELTNAIIEFSKKNNIEELVIECSKNQQISKYIAEKFCFSYEDFKDGLEIYKLKI